MAMPKVLDWLDDLVAKVATNTTNIATNKTNIAANKKSIDDHKKDDVRHWTTADRQNFNRVVHFKGYFTTIQALKTAYPTGQVGDYGIVGETDTVWLWDDTKNEWLNSTEQGIVISVNGRTGEVILTKTDVGLSNVDNTSDKNKPISDAQQEALDDKADRLQISASDVDGFTLRAGIYYMFEPRTILGKEATEWTIIVGEYPDMMDVKPATQLWISWNGMSDNEQHIYMRHRDINNGTEFWSEFKELSTNIDISGLQTQITTNKNNIKTNADDIDALELNKADRKKVTSVEADSLSLKAGLYYLYNESKTLLGFTSSCWNIIVGNGSDDDNTFYSSTQIWYNFASNDASHVYIRHQKNRQWGEFVEILTTKDISKTEISRVKQYKGYFATVQTLKTAYPTAKDGDYAIVGNALYIWNSKSTSWTEVSGSGGSGGSGKWSVKRYDCPSSITEPLVYLKDIPKLTFEKQWEIDDTSDYLINEASVNYKAFLFETFVNMDEATTINTSIVNDDGFIIYINGKEVGKRAGSSNVLLTIPLQFVQGWNKVQIILREKGGEEKLKLGVSILNDAHCLKMDCYHNFDTVVDGAYVPLVGDSVIEGKIQVQGTIGITNKSYLQYNEADDSLSFMFSDNMDI